MWETNEPHFGASQGCGSLRGVMGGPMTERIGTFVREATCGMEPSHGWSGEDRRIAGFRIRRRNGDGPLRARDG